MADKPILMAGSMVRAILEGRKTVTRRLIRQASMIHGECTDDVRPFGKCSYSTCARNGTHMTGQFRPPYEIGDRMWVRETWARADDPKWLVAYRADGRCGAWGWDGDGAPIFMPHGYIIDPARGDHLGNYGLPRYGGRWRPSIHMPRCVSRLMLPVIDVRAERLQDITDEDAIAEGLRWRPAIEAWTAGADNWPTFRDPRRSFLGLWNHLAKPGTRWDDNPWVWRVEFPAQAGRQIEGDQ